MKERPDRKREADKVKGKNSPERLLEEIIKLEPVQFIGVCKIIGVDIYDTKVKVGDKIDEETGQINADITPRPFEEIWFDVCDTIDGMNRTRRRNLAKLIYPATKKEK